jgi:hypothetical protein
MPHFTPSIDLKRVSVLPIRAVGETLEMFYLSTDENKAMSVRLNDHSNYILRRYMVPCLFDIPTVEAARILHISLSLLKRIRSWANLGCWPCSLIHCGGHPLYTRKQVVEKRELVIEELEKEFVKKPSSQLGLTVNILKEVRQYAAIYHHLVIPGAGRRNRVVFVELKPSKCVKKGDSDEVKDGVKDGVKDVMASMQPRQVERKTALSAGSVDTGLITGDSLESLDSTLEAIEADVWHTVETGYFSDVEDELGLGPITTPVQPVSGLV